MKRQPIHWRRSDRMRHAYLSQLVGYLAAVAAALLPFAAHLRIEVVIACAVVLALAGVMGVRSGRSAAKRRRACGTDPARPEAPIHRGPQAASKEAP